MPSQEEKMDVQLADDEGINLDTRHHNGARVDGVKRIHQRAGTTACHCVQSDKCFQFDCKYSRGYVIL